MTSQLNVDTIVDKAGSGGTNVKVGNTSTYVSDGGNVTQNTVQSLCKFFSNINGTSTIATRDSFNQSGIIDRGTGDYDLTFTNNMGNDDYATMNNADSASGHLALMYGESEQHTTGCRAYVVEASGGVTDTAVVMTSLVGDLA